MMNQLASEKTTVTSRTTLVSVLEWRTSSNDDDGVVDPSWNKSSPPWKAPSDSCGVK